jgi:DNA-binding NtrC family response regulator
VRRCVRSPEHGHQRVANDVEPLPTSFEPGTSYRDRVRAAERQILESAIRAFNGNKSAAARALGLERAHFAKTCRAVGIVGTEPSLLRQA